MYMVLVMLIQHFCRHCGSALPVCLGGRGQIAGNGGGMVGNRHSGCSRVGFQKLGNFLGGGRVRGKLVVKEFGGGQFGPTQAMMVDKRNGNALAKWPQQAAFWTKLKRHIKMKHRCQMLFFSPSGRSLCP